MKALSSPKFGQFQNIFSLDDLAQIKQILLKIPNVTNDNGTTLSYAYTNGFDTSSLIYPFIQKKVISKLENILNVDLHLTVGMLLREFKPWLIHTDYVKGDPNPGLAVLIPLHTEFVDTNTVIFNEECIDNFASFRKNNPILDNNAVHLYENLLSHESRENLEYVSLAMVAPWTPGSVIYWDRKLLHTSDNFLKKLIKEKQALVLFFNNQS